MGKRAASAAKVPTRRWSDLTDTQRAVVLLAASVQLSLAATAWADLAKRPAAQVNGRKGLWALIIAVNFVGPLSYLRWGRRRADTPSSQGAGQ